MRILPLLGGLAGAVALSQFPEFSQQYLQRLGGQADALAEVVADFDASAEKAGLTRQAALADLSASAFQVAHQGDMRGTIARAEAAQADLALLRAASPLERMMLPHRFRDGETLAATWADFRPAVPATGEGAVSAGVGFAGGWTAAAVLIGIAAAPFRRSRRA
ncbi:MAG: DUF2937 family protein [Paracoccaceae bacterium]